MTMAGPKIQIQRVAKSFGAPGHPTPALGEIDLDVAEREFVCLLGPSGCGTRPAAERRRTVERYLNLVGLSAHADKFPVQLSGGMKQRVALARALANNPSVILMDEPFGALDAQTREVLQDELSRIQRVEHKTILFVTHSIREAVYLADRVVVMTSVPGRIKQVFAVKLPEVRDRFAPEFTQYESDITRVVKEEVAKVRE